VQLLQWFGRTIAPHALRIERRSPPRWLTVLAYHRVAPRPPGDYPFDREVLDCDPARFDEHMEMVARHCTPIGLDHLLAFLDGEPLPPNPVLVTFDDGYRDNRDHALPILVRHKVPAVFFVATSYVAERRVFWWDRVAYLFHHAQVAAGRLSYPTEIVLRPGGDGGRAHRMVLRLLKTCPEIDLERFLDELGRALRVPWDYELEQQLADDLVMTWADLRELSDAGMEIGSHTRTHRVLHTVPLAELPVELRQSRAEIERAVRRPVRAISYPVGRTLRTLPSLGRAVRDAGYRVGFSTESRANPTAAVLDPLDLARVTVDTCMTRDQLTALLAAPELCRAW